MIEDHVMKDMEVTIENTKKIFSTQDDVKYKVTLIRGEPELKVVIVYIDGMVKITSVNEDIIRPFWVGRDITRSISCSFKWRNLSWQHGGNQ